MTPSPGSSGTLISSKTPGRDLEDRWSLDMGSIQGPNPTSSDAAPTPENTPDNSSTDPPATSHLLTCSSQSSESSDNSKTVSYGYSPPMSPDFPPFFNRSSRRKRKVLIPELPSLPPQPQWLLDYPPPPREPVKAPTNANARKFRVPPDAL